MAENDRDRWYRLPKLSLDKRSLSKRMRKVETATVRHANRFIIKRWKNARESSRHIIGWIIGVGLLIAAAGLQLMWYQQSYRTDIPAVDGTYAEAVLGPLNTLNPIFASSSAERSAGYLMFSRLLNYDDTGHLSNDLATSITTNKDNTVYTVEIRPDVKWNDGILLSAKDVAFTVNLMKNPAVRSTITGWNEVGVKVVDDTTLQFTLKTPYAAFKHVLTFPVLPEHILGDVPPVNIRENSFSQNPVGSGPFKLRFTQDVETSTDRKVVHLARNDQYYNGVPKLARFQLHVYAQPEAILRALKLSEVNAATDLTSIDVADINKARYDVVTTPVQKGVYALLNVKSDNLKDVNIRRALRLATNTEAIREKLPVEMPALDLPFTNGQLTGDVPTAPGYNKASAEKILSDDGWKKDSTGVLSKDGKQLKLSVVATKDNELERVLEIISGQWRELGIDVESKVIDLSDTTQNVAQDVLQQRNYDVLLSQLNIGADPDVYAYWHSSQATPQGSNLSNYSNVISDDALLTARARSDVALRNAKYITFAKQWLNDIPAIGLYQSTTQYVHSKSIKAYDDTAVLVSPIDRYSNVVDWSVGSQPAYKTP
ncbi:MAG TPA: peptide ABC transporter substrate-binding protein [Candidatus Saccharibacteria bacterium]|nr:peptide ABC transporter substrate-binding protein [Candidatus Saccharibacteria bacterium]HRQ06552.1 peptide ABC transporter substrate-binding protein [Candidatus Saccharibacteria bacterium]